MSISHPQVSWALIISQYVRLWLTTFSGVRPCQENRVLCIISDWFFSPPPAGSRTGFFSYLLQEPGQAPEGKSHNIVGLSSCLGPQEFLTLRLAHTEPLAICQLQLRFSYWLLSLCSKKPCLPVVTYLSVSPVLGARVFPVSSPLLQIPEEVLIFQFGFLLVSMECDC